MTIKYDGYGHCILELCIYRLSGWVGIISSVKSVYAVPALYHPKVKIVKNVGLPKLAWNTESSRSLVCSFVIQHPFFWFPGFLVMLV